MKRYFLGERKGQPLMIENAAGAYVDFDAAQALAARLADMTAAAEQVANSNKRLAAELAQERSDRQREHDLRVRFAGAVEALEAAWRAYGRHQIQCQRYGADQCTCGFVATERALKPTQPMERSALETETKRFAAQSRLHRCVKCGRHFEQHNDTADCPQSEPETKP